MVLIAVAALFAPVRHGLRSRCFQDIKLDSCWIDELEKEETRNEVSDNTDAAPAPEPTAKDGESSIEKACSPAACTCESMCLLTSAMPSCVFCSHRKQGLPSSLSTRPDGNVSLLRALRLPAAGDNSVHADDARHPHDGRLPDARVSTRAYREGKGGEESACREVCPAVRNSDELLSIAMIAKERRGFYWTPLS